MLRMLYVCNICVTAQVIIWVLINYAKIQEAA